MKLKYKLSLGAIIVALLTISVSAGVRAYNAYYVTDQGYGVLASSTAKYVIGGTATTTKVSSSDGLQKVSYLVAVGSSTTPPTVCWRTQYSNNGVDWYGSQQATSTYTENQVETSDCWNAATSTISANDYISTGPTGKEIMIGRRIVVDGIDTQFVRTKFSINPGVNALLDVVNNSSNQVIVNKN